MYLNYPSISLRLSFTAVCGPTCARKLVQPRRIILSSKPKPGSQAASKPFGTSTLSNSNTNSTPVTNMLPPPVVTQHAPIPIPQVAVVVPPPAPRPVVPPSEPLFVAIPPRPQKLVHSEAYVRYIESLHTNPAERRYMTNWDKSLHATSSNTRVQDAEQLPAHWLGNGPGLHGTTVEALWALRNFMMRDSLNLRKIMH